MIEAALYDLLNESIKVEKLLSQAEVTEYFERTAVFDNRFTRRARSYSFGNGPCSCLFYSLNNKNLTAGGTGLVSLVNLLQKGLCNFKHMPVTWHFLPGLKLDSNSSLGTFRNTVKELKPEIICAVEERSSDSEPESAHFFLKSALTEKHSSLIKHMYEKSGIELESRGSDPVMGRGFSILTPEREPLLVEIPRSCQYFRVALNTTAALQPADQVYLLMSAVLVAVDSITAKSYQEKVS